MCRTENRECLAAESDRLVRLPMYYKLTVEDQNRVIKAVRDFYGV